MSILTQQNCDLPQYKKNEEKKRKHTKRLSVLTQADVQCYFQGEQQQGKLHKAATRW